MDLTRRQALLLIAAVLVALGLLVAADQLIERVSPWDYDDAERWMKDLGAWGPILYILFFAASMIVAPVPTTPAPFAAAAAFGSVAAFFYTMIAGAIGASVTFYIARRWGRPILERLMAERTVRQVDRLADQLGLRVLIYLRLFPIFGADYVSYAAGLTRMRFAPYLAISAIASVPILIAASVVGENVTDNKLVAGIALAVLAAFLILPLSYFALRKRRSGPPTVGVPPAEADGSPPSSSAGRRTAER